MSEEGLEHGAHEFPVLIRREQIGRKVAELAQSIAAGHPGGEGMHVLGILKGSLLFVADLVRQLACPLQIEMVRVKSYDGDRPGDEVRVEEGASVLEVQGKHVLVVDTIVDTGRTLRNLYDLIVSRRPASVKTCVLIEKERSRQIEPDYVGFTIGDVFVVGYGLDYRDRWRHLPYVAQLPERFLDEQRGSER